MEYQKQQLVQVTKEWSSHQEVSMQLCNRQPPELQRYIVQQKKKIDVMTKQHGNQ